MRAFVLLLPLTLLAAACRTAPEAAGGDTTAPAVNAAVTLARLGSSPDVPFLQNSGIEDSMRFVIEGRAEWEAFWARMHAPYGEKPAVPAVDFTREVVVVAAMGTRASGGFGIFIDSARVEQGSVVVHVRSVTPGASCGVTAALTEPVDVARLTRTGMPVRFVETSVARDCR